MIVLDTHVLLWLTQEPEKLGNQTTQLIKEKWQNRQVAVSAFSFWECQMLQNKGRIQIPYSIDLWRDKLLRKGLIEYSLDGETGIISANLTLHGDPADRIIVATAIQAQAILVTADLKILSWENSLIRQDAKK